MTSATAYGVNSYYSRRYIDYSILQQVHDLYPLLVMSLLMGVGMYLIGVTIDTLLLQLLVQSLVGMSVYLVLNFILGRAMLVNVLNLARQVIYLPAAS